MAQDCFLERCKEKVVDIWPMIRRFGTARRQTVVIADMKCDLRNKILLGMYPCSTKTREVLGKPSPTPKIFPETQEISQGPTQAATIFNS